MDVEQDQHALLRATRTALLPRRSEQHNVRVPVRPQPMHQTKRNVLVQKSGGRKDMYARTRKPRHVTEHTRMHESTRARACTHLCELVLHGHQLRAELLLVEVVESGDLLQADGGVELEVRSNLWEQDLLLHLLHEQLGLRSVHGVQGDG